LAQCDGKPLAGFWHLIQVQKINLKQQLNNGCAMPVEDHSLIHGVLLDGFWGNTHTGSSGDDNRITENSQ
jgi:hypothetical protein